ncbi:Ubiquinone/menaquinone biosynthesis C-methylase UbiE [Haloechinothrix alba]|uniref:Ubiquinone/menaquinone biosynthesis C-methylase UbiE n=1 Tax=Haloechinothrix alba TaxID=664784 RepID=A0A238W692_9PSEU|nr:nitrate/nitrite transporter NrtS [Haloechinothrix alba]SNR42070.1 Ubiquinone/menaquinone biosynthesis C-methylase UbiE [Haloechinothrix alba]
MPSIARPSIPAAAAPHRSSRERHADVVLSGGAGGPSAAVARDSGAERCERTARPPLPDNPWSTPSEAVRLVLRGRTARQALPIAAVVGTILSAVNQGSVIASATATGDTWLKVGVNYAVPYLVASIGYLAGRRVTAQRAPDALEWQRYVAAFHDERPAVTERLLARADHSPYDWLTEPLHGTSGPVLDLACGSAPTRDVLPHARWLGVDSSAGELAAAARAGREPVLRARADALPLGTGSVDAVCAALCFPLFAPIGPVLAEIHHVLRPGGTLVALVPSRPAPHPTGWLRWTGLMRALGIRSQPWPTPEARDGLGTILREHGFTVDSEQRRVFTLDLSTPDSVELLIDGLYLPGHDERHIADAKRRLAGRARPGHRLPLPLRRVVAHLPA